MLKLHAAGAVRPSSSVERLKPTNLSTSSNTNSGVRESNPSQRGAALSTPGMGSVRRKSKRKRKVKLAAERPQSRVERGCVRTATRQSCSRFDALAREARQTSLAAGMPATRWAILGRDGDVVEGSTSTDLGAISAVNSIVFGSPVWARRNVRRARVEHAWLRPVGHRLRVLLRDLYGTEEDAREHMSTREFEIAVEQAFDAVGSGLGVHVLREKTSIRTRRALAREIDFNTSRSVWRDKKGATVMGRLALMRPRHVPDIADARGLRRDVTIFILDLCSGTKTYERAVRRFHLDADDAFVVISIDWDEKTNPTFVRDVTKWRDWYPQLQEWMSSTYPGFAGFHHVHFSGECTELCATKEGHERDTAKALWLILCGASLITQISPPVWTMESSAWGAHHLATHDVMKPLAPRKIPELIHFCKAGGLGNLKPGAWWTNMSDDCVEHILSFQCKGEHKCLFKWCFGGHYYVSQRGGHIRAGGRLKGQYQPGMARNDYMGIPVMIAYEFLTAAIKMHIPKRRALDDGGGSSSS